MPRGVVKPFVRPRRMQKRPVRFVWLPTSTAPFHVCFSAARTAALWVRRMLAFNNECQSRAGPRRVSMQLGGEYGLAMVEEGRAFGPSFVRALALAHAALHGTALLSKEFVEAVALPLSGSANPNDALADIAHPLEATTGTGRG